jgi:hypothetical protein
LNARPPSAGKELGAMKPKPLSSSLALLVALAAASLTGPARAAAAEPVADQLRRQTQEMADALVPGNAAVWDRYLDADAVYTTEDGTLVRKAQMLKDMKPLPAGVSGAIKVIDFAAVVSGPVAVTTYVDDEDETYHGHVLHCQYRETDTWHQTPAGWRLLAGQVIALRTDPPAVALSAQQAQEICGTYSLDATIRYEIRCQGSALTGQRSGRDPETLRAEAPDVLFVPGRPRYRMIVQRAADGHVTGYAERREAWSILWTRVP